MQRVREIVRQRLDELGLNMAEVSRRIGRNHAYMQQFLERGVPKRLPDDIRKKLSMMLGVPEEALGGIPSRLTNVLREPVRYGRLNVLGGAKAGAWLEVDAAADDQSFDEIAIGPSSIYPADKQYLLLVQGQSVSRRMADGEYAHCVAFEAVGRDPRDGELVHVERIRHDAGLREVTIKVYRNTNGHAELWPDSNDPRYSKPLRLDNGEDGVTVEIRGIVIGRYQPFSPY